MPILARETEIFPEDLFEVTAAADDPDSGWWALYTLSRREKDLMRKLRAQEVPFYCPIIPKRNRSPAGRIRTSYVPLFTNYVFLFGDDARRYHAVSSGCVSRCLEVTDGEGLRSDLARIHELIQAGVPLTLESRLQPGMPVRIRSGPFKGYEGSVIRREGHRRLLVSVNFLEQGASFVLEDCELEWLDTTRLAS